MLRHILASTSQVRPRPTVARVHETTPLPPAGDRFRRRPRRPRACQEGAATFVFSHYHKLDQGP